MTDGTKSIRVRRARKADAREVAVLANELGRWIMKQDGTTTADDIRRHAFGPQRWCDIIVATDGKHITGYALYRTFFECFTGNRRFFLSDLGVASESRRDGTGHKLMAAIARRAVELECDIVTWECSHDNFVALGFYEKLNAVRLDNVVHLHLAGEELDALATEA